MLSFQVKDMTCGHCASAIARAVASVDPHARLDIRIQDKLVRIDSTAPAGELAEAIAEAGYTPREVADPPSAQAAPRASAGCGCGCASRRPAPLDAGQAAAPVGGSCCG